MTHTNAAETSPATAMTIQQLSHDSAIPNKFSFRSPRSARSIIRSNRPSVQFIPTTHAATTSARPSRPRAPCPKNLPGRRYRLSGFRHAPIGADWSVEPNAGSAKCVALLLDEPEGHLGGVRELLAVCGGKLSGLHKQVDVVNERL